MSTYLEKGQAVLDGDMTWTAFQDWHQSMGVNDFAGALAGVACPMDIMHIVFEGVVRQMLGALSYIGCRYWGWSPFAIAKRISAYAIEQGLKIHDFPYLNGTRIRHLTEGQGDGLPSSDCSFPGTAGQIARVILHVQGIFGAMTAEHKKDPVWQVTLRLGKICRLLWQRSFTVDDILNLDESIWLHDELMLGTPMLAHLWKPKNHYLSHLPLEIVRWGPPRNYWCIPFEHENQLVKNSVSHSNYNNVLQTAAEDKALVVALQASAWYTGKRKQRDWECA